MIPFRWNVILFLLLLIIHLLLYPFAELRQLGWFGNAAQSVALFFAAIHFSRAAKKVEKEFVNAFNLVALGFWISFMAHLLLSYSEILLHKPATGTVTDAIWLCAYLLIARSLILLLRVAYPSTARLKIPLLTLIGSTAIVVLALWSPLTDENRDYMTRFIQMIFPLLDFWDASMAFYVARKYSGWWFAMAGSIIIGIADIIFPYYHETISPQYRFLDIPLFAGYSLWWMSGAYLASRVRASAIRSS